MNIASHLETERLLLAPMTPSDFLFFWRLAGDTNVRQFLGGPVPWRRRLTQFRQYLRGDSKTGVWVVRPQRQDAAIGLMVLNPHKDGADYEVSYIFNHSSWGQGFATEATAQIVDHALNDLGLKRVIAETQSANAASCRMLAKLGFSEEARLERFGAEQVIFARS